jgi:hypothetical protein
MKRMAIVNGLFGRSAQKVKAVGTIYFLRAVVHSVFRIAAAAPYGEIICDKGVLDSGLAAAIPDKFPCHDSPC